MVSTRFLPWKVTETIGWVYEADRDKIKQAQQDLDDFYLDDKLNDLEDTKDKEIEILQERIDAWDLYLKALDWRHGEYERMERDRLLKELLNVETEEELRERITDDMEKFNLTCEGSYKEYIGIFTNFLDEYRANLEELAELTRKQLELMNSLNNLQLNNSLINTGELGGNSIFEIASAAGMSQSSMNALKAAGDRYNAAKEKYLATGDEKYVEEMNKAHQQAEAIRAEYGYSGGRDGSGYIPLDNSGSSSSSSSSGGSSSSGSSSSGSSSSSSSSVNDSYKDSNGNYSVSNKPSQDIPDDVWENFVNTGHYSNGIENGPVTYTGLAMLHGSRNSPEYVLNSDQAYTLLRNMATTRLPEYTSNATSGGTQYIVQGDVVLEGVNNPAEFWQAVSNAMGTRWNVTKKNKI